MPDLSHPLHFPPSEAEIRQIASDITTNAAALSVLSDAVQASAGEFTQTEADARYLAAAGTAAKATILATARAINGVNFDGSAAITVPAAASTLTGTTLAATVVASSLTSVGTLAALTVTAKITGSVSGTADGAAPVAVAGGAAATIGEATLGAGGTVDVATTLAGATSHVFLTRKTAGGTIGMAVTYTLANGVGFTITSDNILDRSVYSWLLINA